MTPRPPSDNGEKNETELAPQVKEGNGVERTPQELRSEEIFRLSDELDWYDGPKDDFDLELRIKQIQEEYARPVDGMIDISEKTGERLGGKMSYEIASAREMMDKYRENRHELLKLQALDMISDLEAMGIKMSEEEKEINSEILSSPKIINIDRNELADLLNIDQKNAALMVRLKTERDYLKKYGKLLKAQLVPENIKLFSSGAELVGHGSIEIDGQMFDTAELNDPEVAGLGNETINRIIKDILVDKKSTAGQGMFWNVLVPKEIPYVLKTEKEQEDRSLAVSNELLLMRYPIIRDDIGREFLPKQAVLQTPGSDRYHILQEKIPLDEMTVISGSNIESFINPSNDKEKEYGSDVRKALEETENKKILKKFIEGVERLYRDHHLMIDIVGDNLFFNVDSDGRLEIKLPDYGAIDTKWKANEGKDDPIVKSALELIDKLKELL